MRNLSAKWVPKWLNADQKLQRFQSSEQLLTFFDAIQMISRRDWWPWKKPGYITVTWRQSNNQWIGGIAVHPAPKYSECKNPLENSSLRFFGIKKASSSLIIFQRSKLSTRSITHFCWCNCRPFWRKNAAGSSPKEVLFLPDNAPAHRALATPEETGLLGLPVPWLSTLLSGSDPVGLPPVPCTEKKTIEMSPFLSDAEVIVAEETWLDGNLLNFFEWLAKFRATS